MKAKKLFSGLLLLLALGMLFPEWGQAQLSFKWTTPVIGIAGSPAVGPDGTIYAGTNYGWFYAFNPDGWRKWVSTLVGGCVDTPAIGADGAIIIHDGLILYSLNPADGGYNWVSWAEYPSQFLGSPAIAKNGTIYLGTNATKLLAIDPATGLKLWEFIPSESVVGTAGGEFSNPVIDAHGTIYCQFKSFANAEGFADGWLFAIDPVNHNQIAQTAISVPTFITGYFPSPAIGPDGTLYVNSNRLYALAPADLSTKWTFNTGPTAAPVIAESLEPDDYWIVVPSGQYIFGLEPESGTIRWTLEADMAAGTPAIGNGGLFYFTTSGYSGEFPAAQLCGGSYAGIFDKIPIYPPVHSSPAVVQVGDQNVLYIGENISVSALIIGTSNYCAPGLAPTSWPCERGNLRRNGRVSLVLSASFRVFELRRRVLDLPFAVSLVAKLESAGQSLENEDLIPARNKLKAFINEVNALKGKKILTKEADNLIAAAQDIVSILQ